mgnify:CR=1 FL=1
MKKVLVTVACLLSLSAWAAGALEALRANSRALREQVSSLRASQLSQRNELSQLSARIEALKAQQKGKLLPGGELDSALKRSQELSGVLGGLASELSGRETALETANLALIDGLSSELNRARAEFDRQSNRDLRRALIADMRRLRAERDALRQTLPVSKLPALDTRPSDDPEELLEQADLLRDNEEKVRRQLQQLEARITERREELELDARMQRFLGEESMFDDGDRRLRVQRTTMTTLNAPPRDQSDGFQSNPEGVAGAAPPYVDTTAGSGGSVQNDPVRVGGMEQNATSPPGSFNNGVDSASIRITTASDARPQVGSASRFELDSADLSALQRQQAALKQLSDELGRKAKELESRAGSLK